MLCSQGGFRHLIAGIFLDILHSCGADMSLIWGILSWGQCPMLRSLGSFRHLMAGIFLDILHSCGAGMSHMRHIVSRTLPDAVFTRWHNASYARHFPEYIAFLWSYPSEDSAWCCVPKVASGILLRASSWIYCIPVELTWTIWDILSWGQCPMLRSLGSFRHLMAGIFLDILHSCGAGMSHMRHIVFRTLPDAVFTRWHHASYARHFPKYIAFLWSYPSEDSAWCCVH